MLLTEDEAKTKRCCGPLTTCGMGWSDGHYCIASQCMAWRWGDSFWNRPDIKPDLPTGTTSRGFCGLAGKVET